MRWAVRETNLAHIRADGTLAPWNPGVDNAVRVLAVSGNTVYAAGFFTTLGGQPRDLLGAVDGTTGSATAWTPNPNMQVTTLAVSGSHGVCRRRVRHDRGPVRAGSRRSMPLPGLPRAGIRGRHRVRALRCQDRRVRRRPVHLDRRSARNRIAALDAVTGLATSWDPNSSANVGVLVPDGPTVYAAGSFFTIGGQTRLGLAALDASTGLATGWNPSPGGGVTSLIVSGPTIYAAGFFNSIGGQNRLFAAAVDATTGLATSWNPNPNNPVNALVLGTQGIFFGGIREYWNLADEEPARSVGSDDG